MKSRLAVVQRPWWVFRSSVHLLVVLTGVLRYASCQSLVAKCPQRDSLDNPETYCECSLGMTRSGRTVTIICDFQNMKGVLLTDALYPFRESKLLSAYVRVVNATSVQVTGAFLREWQDAPSASLDVWRSGTLILDATPELTSNRNPTLFTTYVGIGIAGCYVPEIPPKLLRDRKAGSFRIINSEVGVIRKGFIHNVNEMRYLVMENSVVEAVEGSVATEGYINLSRRQEYKWSGLLLSNVTIKNVGAEAFNLVHQGRSSSTK
ncbi:uncharacterized protein LOC121870867 [Homarus americanus]|uniref:uncharacterized protein LOC121870867 n=1 Tax=Homarus americanus TaxID=6706 RepID=UPI001C48AE64|nr:uncharacterized protein LOC121870867 [Homarus americanus]